MPKSARYGPGRTALIVTTFFVILLGGSLLLVQAPRNLRQVLAGIGFLVLTIVLAVIYARSTSSWVAGALLGIGVAGMVLLLELAFRSL